MRHARNSASGAGRWIKCPGSLNLSAKCPEPENTDFAAEGTAAHTLAELALSSIYSTDMALPNEIDGFPVNKEMLDCIQMYTDTVLAEAPLEDVTTGKTILKVEDKFSLEWLHPEMFGTNDCCTYNIETKKLTIFDYKHGVGIVVSPERNEQLMFYGLGAVYSIWSSVKDKPRNISDLVEDIELVIVQPRADHPDGPVRRWTISYNELSFWGLSVLRPSAMASKREDAPLVVGTHCRFCPALAFCPEQIKVACQAAKTNYENPIFPSPEQLTPNDILKVMEISDNFSSWAKQVKAFALRQMELGHGLPGYKLVQRKSNRTWVSQELAAQTIEPLLGDRAYARSLLSVAQTEKALKALEIDHKETLKHLWHKVNTGVTMAPMSDRRKEVESSAFLDFSNHLDFLQ